MNRREFLKSALVTGVAAAFGKVSFETAEEETDRRNEQLLALAGGVLTPVPHRWWGAVDAGGGRWICFSDGGSDEDGDGTHEHPVATEVCARELANG